MFGPNTRATLRISFAFLICLALALPAMAFQPVEQNGSLEIQLPRFLQGGYTPSHGYDRDANGAEVAATLSARLGREWQVYSWNPMAGTPHMAYGHSVKLAERIDTEAQLAELARRVILENGAELNADLDDLRLTATPNAMGKWVAHFQQTYEGLDVHDALVRIGFSEDGKLVLMGSDCYAGIDVNATPTIDEAAAIQLAKAGVGFNPATDRMDGATELLILPVPTSETTVAHHLVWKLRVRTEDPLGIWVTYMDAHTGTILWRTNDIHFAYGGDTEADTYEWGYCDGASLPETMPWLRIDVSGLGSTVSDENGDWTIAGGSGNLTVSCDMEGTYCDVYNNAAGAEAFFSGTAADGVPFTVDWDDTNSQQDERDVMQGVTEVRKFISQFDAGFGYINQQMGAEVSINSSCNAYWDGDIHFYREAGGCANTGELHQVVHHEFGHGVQWFIIGGQGNEGLGEGNSDILGIHITQDSVIGRGFYLGNCGSGIRDADNNLQYPDDLNGQVHHDGQIIAGFSYDGMLLFQDAYGGGMNWQGAGTIMSAERWHFGRILLTPTYQDDQVFATFFADDDNGDMADGTPNHAILCEAAQNHGYECPAILVGVFIYHEDIPYSGDQDYGYDVNATVMSLGGGAILAGSVELSYRVDGGAFSSVPMSAAGPPDEYVGTIPVAPYGSEVEYYLYAENDLAASGYSPPTAPADLHYFQVDQSFVEEMEFDTTWRVGSAEEETASSGNWERADPEATAYSGQPLQPEDDHTAAGTDCWVTGAAAGAYVGANDVDGGRTVVYSPRFDLQGAADVMIGYWRYFTDDQAQGPQDGLWLVEITNDDGASWSDVENTSDGNPAWVEVGFALADYFAVPGIVQMRFTAGDETPTAITEALLDDFTLSAIFDLTSTDDEFAVSFVTELGQNHPNPFNPRTAIKFSLEQASPVSLQVFDLNGRVVKTLADGSMAAGGHEVVWNGQDENGSSLASGVYFYRLQAEGRTMNRRMVLIK